MLKTFVIVFAVFSTQAWAGGETLTGDQIMERIIGNTIVDTDNRALEVKYFSSDGSIRVEDKDGRYDGVWAIRENKLCVGYEDDNGNMSEAKDCMTVKIKGNRVTMSNGDVVRLEQGNARNLSQSSNND
jgi:hypothetical protein